MPSGLLYAEKLEIDKSSTLLMIFRVPGIKHFSLKNNIFKDSVLGGLGPRFGSILETMLVAGAIVLGSILVPGVTQGLG